jgi:Transposase, Mutator family
VRISTKKFLKRNSDGPKFELLRLAGTRGAGQPAFPTDHWRKLRSRNPLECVSKEIGRCADVVGIFPDSLIRLASILAIEQNDEWLVGRRYLSAPSTHRGGSPRVPTGLGSALTDEHERELLHMPPRDLTSASAAGGVPLPTALDR